MAAPEKQKYMLYNNMMFTVACHLVEVKTGKSFSTFLREKFFEPLGMTSTYLQASSAIASGQSDRLASGHQFDEEKGTWDEFDAPDAPEAQGAGSIVTSAADYIKYVQALLHSRHPISADSRKALIQPRIMTDTEGNVSRTRTPSITLRPLQVLLPTFYVQGIKDTSNNKFPIIRMAFYQCQ